MALLSVPGGGRDRCRDEFALQDLQFAFGLHGSHWRSVESEWSYPQHEHPLLELNLVIEGHQWTEINGQVYEQGPGELLIIPPGIVHSSRSGMEEGMTYFCLHLDIDDRSFMSFVNPSELLYDSDSSMTRRIRPILDSLLEAARCSSGVSLNVNDRIKLRNSVLSLLIALGEETMTASEAAQTPAESPHKGSSPEIMKLREQNLLETRLQDLFYEPQSPGLPVDETLYPPHRWIGLFSLTSPIISSGKSPIGSGRKRCWRMFSPTRERSLSSWKTRG